MTSEVVIDASVVVRLAIRTQPGHEAAVRAYSEAFGTGAEFVAPDLMPYEAGNAILKDDGTKEAKAKVLVEALQVATLVRPSSEAFAAAMGRASESKLSYYDASYLALAEERNAVLWTEDGELLKRQRERAADTQGLLRRLIGR